MNSSVRTLLIKVFFLSVTPLYYPGEAHGDNPYSDIVSLAKEVGATNAQVSILDKTIGDFRAETKEEFKNVRTEMKEGFDKVDQEFKNVRAEMKEGFDKVDQEFKNVRAEMKEGFDKVDQEFKNVRTEMKEGFGKVDQEFKNVRTEMKEGFNILATQITEVNRNLVAQITEVNRNLVAQITEVNRNLTAEISETNSLLRLYIQRADKHGQERDQEVERRLQNLEAHWSNHLSRDFLENPMTYLSGLAWVVGIKSAGVLPLPLTIGSFVLHGMFSDQLLWNLFGGAFSKPTEIIGFGITTGISGGLAYYSWAHAQQIAPYLTLKTLSLPVALLAIIAGITNGESLGNLGQKVLNLFLPKPR